MKPSSLPSKFPKIYLYKDKLKGHKDSVTHLYSPQGTKGNILVSVSKDGRLKGWDLYGRGFVMRKVLVRGENAIDDAGGKTESPGVFESVESALFNERTAFCGYGDGAIYGWNMKEGNLIYDLQGHTDKVISMIWTSPDRFISASFDQTLIYWDLLVTQF
jgi:WD40 repeat protein